MRFAFRALYAGLLLPAALAAQQMAAPASVMPKVGDMAPDFTLAAGTRAGVSAKPVKLSELRGQTVVIAFYPKQRSGGCTIQMRHYRDAYQQIFNGGKGVTLLAISTDSVKDIASWAADSSFQWTFLSDVNKDAGMAYATATAGRYEHRVVFVVAPNGKISFVMNPFNEVDATSYETLTKAINDAKGMK
jgi:thioredoxin-dependent peroxiredoxin